MYRVDLSQAEHDRLTALLSGQIASNSAPLFACNLDPLVMACAGSP